MTDLSFLPTRSPHDDDTFDFISPANARVLPEPLADAFDDDSSKQSFLFGSHIVSLQFLGERATKCLRDVGLFTELKPNELEERWRDGLVGDWLGLFDEGARHALLTRLLEALTALDELEPWRRAELICLPTEAGTWTHRGAVRRFPSEWNVLAQEPLIRSALISYVGPPDTLLAWQKDSAWIRGSSPALRYLTPESVQTLEKVVAAWWDGLPAEPDPGQVDQVLHFTSWVRGKQQQRKELLRKLLCIESDGRIFLRESSSALLAEPYAGAFRRLFYPDLPSVASHYLDSDSSVGVEVWRSYFESLNPPPRGKFSLRRTARSVSRGDLTEQMGGNYTPPYLRSTEAYFTWSGLTISYYAITLLDWELPKVVKDSFQDTPLSKEAGSALAHWLLEASGLLREYPIQRIVYIPFGGSNVAFDKLPASSTWVRELTENAWIYNTKGNGPLRPSEVLAAFDPARPDAPVADLPGELVTTLQQAGIQFGTSIPNAPAIARLRVDGQTANSEKLLELFRNAVDEADDEAKRSLLLKTISQQNLFPISQGVVRTIDGLTRVPYHRLVRTATRSTLGEWVVPIERFKEGSAERNLFEAVHAFIGIPDSTTANQVMDFLEWVWESTPEADRLRRFLPFAYQYLRYDLSGDISVKERWNVLAREARVFTTGRRWVEANEGTVFLDDLNNALLLDVLDGVDLATPGHLGPDLDEQIATANLLGLNLLSSRFSVEVLVEGELPLPDAWQTGFEIIQEQLRNRLGANLGVPSDDEGVSGTPPDFPTLKLTRWLTIRTLIFDGSKELHSAATKVAVHEGTIAVAGEPDDFADELCKALFNAWGLRLRRDLVDLIPTVAIMLTKIGNQSAVLSWSAPAQESTAKDVSEEIPTSPVGTQKLTQGEAGGERLSVTANKSTTPASANDITKPSPVGDTGDSDGAEAFHGGSYTAATREARIQSLLKKRKDIDKQLDQLATAGLLPDVEDESSSNETVGEFPSDDAYRDAVIAYERKRNRFAAAKSSTQKGHDIDSFTHPDGHPERRLVRRIEVKGRSTGWDGDQIVEMSDAQFMAAVAQLTEDDVQPTPDFDYWLYVVETDKNGEHHVLPIHNPALRASKFELRAGTWRDFIEHEEIAAESDSPS